MQLSRYSPWELMHSFGRDVDRLFQSNGNEPRFVPAIDIHEEAKRYVIHADVPGVNAAEIDITVDGDLLKISGERSVLRPADGAAAHRVERARGRFERQFRLPETVAKDGVEASYSDGVLTVSIPKIEEPEPYRIEVAAN